MPFTTDPASSSADIQPTRPHREASRIIGVDLVDHVIGNASSDPTSVGFTAFTRREFCKPAAMFITWPCVENGTIHVMAKPIEAFPAVGMPEEVGHTKEVFQDGPEIHSTLK